MSSTCWDIVELLLKVLTPFRNAIQLISGAQCPTVGLTLFVIRRIQQNFLEIVKPDDDETIQNLKQLIHEKLIYFTSSNEYGVGFSKLIVSHYSYHFDDE